MSSGPIELTDETGAVRFKGTAKPPPGGGSGLIDVVRVPIAFDTPDLVLAGITLYTPTPRDVLLAGSIVSVPTAWDGTIPTLWLWADDGSTSYNSDYIAQLDLRQQDGNANASAQISVPTGVAAGSIVYQSDPDATGLPFRDASPLKATVDDFSGGDPGSLVGVGEILLLIAKAS